MEGEPFKEITLKKGDMIHIKWIDAKGGSGWCQEEDIKGPAICTNIGFIHSIEDEYIQIMDAFDEEEKSKGNWWTILKSNILEWCELVPNDNGGPYYVYEYNENIKKNNY